MSDLYTDDDVQQAWQALNMHQGGPLPWVPDWRDRDAGDPEVVDIHVMAAVLDAVLPAYRARLLSEVFTRLIRSFSYGVDEPGMRNAIAIVKTMYDEETP